MATCFGPLDRSNVAKALDDLAETIEDLFENFLSEFSRALSDAVVVDAQVTYVVWALAKEPMATCAPDTRADFLSAVVDSEPECAALDVAPVPQHFPVARITWTGLASTIAMALRRTPLARRPDGRRRSWLPVPLPVAGWRRYPPICRLFKQRR
jgi:hypothetical protein